MNGEKGGVCSLTHSLPPLRFLTCGSVDDGKSTLIGRLLFEQGAIPVDQVEVLRHDSRKHGTTKDELDFALLLDGLEAEREQGITIDVAYRYFTTSSRRFIVADSPGHEQFTRNMVTGASNSELAILLVDARKGLQLQTRRHSFIVSLLRIGQVILAVNKMDLVDYQEQVFNDIAEEYMNISRQVGIGWVACIPLSALMGDNVSSPSEKMRWYNGPSLMKALETVVIRENERPLSLRFPVQWVNRPHGEFRGLCGSIAAGEIRVGQSVTVSRSGQTSTVAKILGSSGEVEHAAAGDAVTLTMSEHIDIARGDLLFSGSDAPYHVDQFAAHLIWMQQEPLLPGRSYLMKIGPQTVPASVTDIKHKVEVSHLIHAAAKTLEINDIGACNIVTSAPVSFDKYGDCRRTGAFILIDRETNMTAAAGMIDFPLRRATNVRHQAYTVTRHDRARIKHQRPAVLWFTGLSGAGKSTIANLVESKLHQLGVHTFALDGDNLRMELNNDLGFTAADRVENIRRAGAVAKLMCDAGLVVLCSFISPFAADRKQVREMLPEGEFFEVFVDTPLEVCMARDPKGLYKRARDGSLKNLTGVDQPYEAPVAPDLTLAAAEAPAEELANRVIARLVKLGIIDAFAEGTP